MICNNSAISLVKYYFSMVINRNVELYLILMFKIELSEANNWEKL